MTVTAIVGANWGDEGKGKITDYLASKADLVVRFQGGSNAGHTVINDYGKFALHLLPSGVFYPDVINVLGTGVALNMEDFLTEVEGLINKGVPKPKILISDRAQIILPYHKLFDKYEEERLGDKKFGSTKSGIAPFYSDKYYKIGIQVSDLYDDILLEEKLKKNLEIKNVILEHLYKKPPMEVATLMEYILKNRDKIKPYLYDTSLLLNKSIAEGKNILLEGQLGALKDPDHGIYPYTSSSSPLAGFAPVGAGIPPHSIKRIIAVVKAYSTCVGEGPFVTEIFGEDADELRRRGGDMGEYGATTGRPRRMGWFDLVATKYGCRVQGATEVVLTLVDVLEYLDEIPVCIGYEIDGHTVEDFPVQKELEKAQPIYTTLPGWKSDISHIRDYDSLPIEAKNYIEFIELNIGLPITSISVGPHRDDTILR